MEIIWKKHFPNSSQVYDLWGSLACRVCWRMLSRRNQVGLKLGTRSLQLLLLCLSCPDLEAESISFGARSLGPESSSVFALREPGQGGFPFAVRPKHVGSLRGLTGCYRVLPGASVTVRRGCSMSRVCV